MNLLYGFIAEFAETEAFLEAARKTRVEGYRHVRAYAPFPLEGLSEALEIEKDGVAPLALAGGLIGGIGGFFMQWYANVVDYPIDVGGRPLNSWPAFVPITFELTVLGASFFAAFGMVLLNGLPRLHHPVFAGMTFKRVTKDRFFLCIQSDDPRFEVNRTAEFLASLHPVSVQEVRHES